MSNIRYYGLHDPVVLRHVWQHHEFFENAVPYYDQSQTDVDVIKEPGEQELNPVIIQ